MKVTCGIFILDRNGLLLVGNPTGNNGVEGHWSIPKGEQDEGEEAIHTAIRETSEESGLQFTPAELTPLGEIIYKSGKKKLHSYVTQLKCDGIECETFCASLFTNKEGKQLPEIDKFLWVSKEDATRLLHEAQVKLLEQVFNHKN